MRNFDVIVKWNDGSRNTTDVTNLRVLPFDVWMSVYIIIFSHISNETDKATTPADSR